MARKVTKSPSQLRVGDRLEIIGSDGRRFDIKITELSSDPIELRAVLESGDTVHIPWTSQPLKVY